MGGGGLLETGSLRILSIKLLILPNVLLGYFLASYIYLIHSHSFNITGRGFFLTSKVSSVSSFSTEGL